jgi:hypothetical protein
MIFPSPLPSPAIWISVFLYKTVDAGEGDRIQQYAEDVELMNKVDFGKANMKGL